ncbi:3-oxoacyl-ACP synthase III family protein [Riemerella anatipestifer]|uniref:3-oxoacyl-ACP synthase III family protein n=1 Tax=Riemerella anatipestifer TaxID=34085 RepID=UPI00137350B4|nr:ketoacyl-ACP synthase III [Riemerella anatipestifer]MBT0548422.1 ketoacyl-ACP synthase III [Riemerella anatipestifer]MBT0555690.1 ketoacyl-ACP synthase III [Riemerella anatipestifer]MBT0559185.1 ketoacyl-ACP synthase III [Riemerella anatipestifer]NAV15942.1 ketoacyl-ACP synthase III [Riemerella anatipestifer]UZX27520.1 ketoacyl-ACP synthase III [Riemerella anatipestifer]
MPNTVIIGSGSCVPSNIIKGSDFLDSIFFDDNKELIDKPIQEVIDKFVEITEIEERRYSNLEEYNSDLGLKASLEALEDAGIDKEELDYIIYASNFGEVSNSGVSDFMPSMSARLKNKLGIKNLSCINYDMIFGCPGWVEAMILADSLIKAGRAKYILVVGGDTLSKVTDPYDRNKMIFADGAGAVVVKADESKDKGIIADSTLCFNGEELSYLENSSSLNPNVPQDKNYIRMRGRKIYEFALKYVPDAIKSTIDKAGLSIQDIDKILIHQANAKMDHAIISRLHRLYGMKTYDEAIAPMTIQKFGNSSVATVPTMYNLIKKGKLGNHQFKQGGYIVFASVGAGMNINAILYKMD